MTSSDPIRERLDELQEMQATGTCYPGHLALPALHAVLDRLDSGYCSMCDPAIRAAIADALEVEP